MEGDPRRNYDRILGSQPRVFVNLILLLQAPTPFPTGHQTNHREPTQTHPEKTSMSIILIQSQKQSGLIRLWAQILQKLMSRPPELAGIYRLLDQKERGGASRKREEPWRARRSHEEPAGANVADSCTISSFSILEVWNHE